MRTKDIMDDPVRQTYSLEPRILGGKLLSFVLHFAEMWISTVIGMDLFRLTTLGLAALGITWSRQPMSLESQLGGAFFMVFAMVLWMRVRGCDWKMSAEMAIAMIVPWAVVILLKRSLPSALALDVSARTAMLTGMLADMLYRWKDYSQGYALVHWLGSARKRTVLGADSNT